jgi:hypothetical protein
MVVNQVAGNSALARADAYQDACQNECSKDKAIRGDLLPQMPMNIARCRLEALIALIVSQKRPEHPQKCVFKISQPEMEPTKLPTKPDAFLQPIYRVDASRPNAKSYSWVRRLSGGAV